MKNKKRIHFVLFVVICLCLSLTFSFKSDIEKILNKGPFYEDVVDEKVTIYFFYKGKSIKESTEHTNTSDETIRNILTDIGREYTEKISIKMISSEDYNIYYYEDKFRVDSFPKVILINDNGYMIANYENMINSRQIDYVLSELFK